MSQFIDNLQVKFKTTTTSLSLVVCKLFVGFVLGLTFSIIGQQVFSYGEVSLLFVILVSMATFYRLSKSWNFVPLLVFSLICVLIGLLLRMYIMIAPGT